MTDILYPTAWVDELPFLLAPQEQTAWAVANNVNFLASGYHDPEIMGENWGVCHQNFWDPNMFQLLGVASIPQMDLWTTHMTVQVDLELSLQKYPSTILNHSQY